MSESEKIYCNKCRTLKVESCFDIRGKTGQRFKTCNDCRCKERIKKRRPIVICKGCGSKVKVDNKVYCFNCRERGKAKQKRISPYGSHPMCEYFSDPKYDRVRLTNGNKIETVSEESCDVSCL